MIITGVADNADTMINCATPAIIGINGIIGRAISNPMEHPGDTTEFIK